MKGKVLLAAGLCVALIVGMLFVDGEHEEHIEEKTPTIEPRIAYESEPYIKIGFYGSLTGAASVLGQMGQAGCRLAVDEINNSGGINGKKIRFIEYDDQTDPETAEKVVQKMITEDRVDAIIGSHTSGNVVKAAAVTEQAQVLQIGLGTSFAQTNEAYQYLFRATGNSDVYDAAIFDAIQSAGHQKIAIYYASSKYARSGAEKLKQYITDHPNMKVVWFRSHDISQTDFAADLRSLVDSSPDAVILYASSENAGNQLKRLRMSMGYTGTVYSPEAFAASVTRQEAGEGLTNLVFVCTRMIPASPMEALSEKEQTFLERFIKMYGTMPVAETAYRGYDAMMLLAETFRTAKSMDSEDLRQAILELTEYEGVNGVYDFSDRSGDGLKGCRLITIRDEDHIDQQEYHKGN